MNRDTKFLEETRQYEIRLVPVVIPPFSVMHSRARTHNLVLLNGIKLKREEVVSPVELPEGVDWVVSLEPAYEICRN